MKINYKYSINDNLFEIGTHYRHSSFKQRYIKEYYIKSTVFKVKELNLRVSKNNLKVSYLNNANREVPQELLFDTIEEAKSFVINNEPE